MATESGRHKSVIICYFHVVARLSGIWILIVGATFFVNYKMTRNQQLNLTEEYYIKMLAINGATQHHISQKFFHIEDICKGGFRFYSNTEFELEDRVLVLLYFPDGHSQEVSGRICYCDTINDDTTVYGFSVIDGFYSLFI